APLWQLLARPGVNVEIANDVFEALRKAYLGERYYDPSSADDAARRRMTSESLAAVNGATEYEQVVGLAILAMASADLAVPPARRDRRTDSAAPERPRPRCRSPRRLSPCPHGRPPRPRRRAGSLAASTQRLAMAALRVQGHRRRRRRFIRAHARAGLRHVRQ